ncbi:c-type cytochrome [Azospirillum sp. SYSU D00513]|uniref:c-type cytochrome n=1 Tax=Azospirillum sp. SYSU D00513 TaxID=2812561 RepID=UPI001FFEFCEE|nr:c-type cytochrome [Azospirillum sp. SYSU D00513]
MITLFALVLLGGIGALLFSWSGLYNVAASKGHWAITRWFLHFSLENSVETHALPIAPPPLDDTAMVYRGLGHYEGGCKPCHGAPGEAGNPITKQMLPQPPHLPDHVASWTDSELFWIVKHGLKYSGMPAWIAQERDDEVWSVVAFMRRMPDMPADDYRRLARNDMMFDPEQVEETADLIASAGPVGDDLLACGRCHGLRGEGGGAGAFPSLAGQKADYLYEALQAYAQGTRPSGIMQPIAAELDSATMRRLADHYASLTPPAPPTLAPSDRAALKLGETIATQGLPDQGVPACATCHAGPDAPVPDNALYPELRGQHMAYLMQQLQLWKDGKRGGNPLSDIMAAAARHLTAEQIDAVSRYYGSLPPAGGATP